MIEYLKRYQAWRRGEDDRAMECAGIEPVTIAEAIDWTVDRIDELERELDELRQAARTVYRLANDFEIVGEGLHRGPIFFAGSVHGDESEDDRKRSEALERLRPLVEGAD